MRRSGRSACDKLLFPSSLERVCCVPKKEGPLEAEVKAVVLQKKEEEREEYV